MAALQLSQFDGVNFRRNAALVKVSDLIGDTGCFLLDWVILLVIKPKYNVNYFHFSVHSSKQQSVLSNDAVWDGP